MEEMKSNYLETNDRKTCYGCNACEYICPTNAITMNMNEQGFLYPKVDNSKCINCGKCKKICPYHIAYEETKGEIYQAVHKNVEVLKRSQSGGVFTAISDYVLSQNGVVYGATFNDDFAVSHSRATSRDERDKMCGSKYVQSIISKEIIKMIEQDLKNGKIILFTGTPCQCAMILQLFGRDDRLIICDFICHGTPSPIIWHDYIAYIASKNKMKLNNVVFRNKRCFMKGNYTESYYSLMGDEVMANDYGALFYSHLAHRENCFSCQFAKEKRYSDLTIGGFLEHSDFKTEYDSSMVIVNTDNGRQVFDKIKKDILYEKSYCNFYKNQPCLYHPIPKPLDYEKFWKDYTIYSMSQLIKKYATSEIKEKFHIEILRPGEKYE